MRPSGEGLFLESFFRPLLGTARDVKVAISHGTSAKNTALDVKVKCQKKIAKLTPEIMRIRLGEGVLGRQNQDPKKDTKLNQKKEKSEGGVLGVWREGRGSWEMTKSSTRICKVIQHALHPCGGRRIGIIVQRTRRDIAAP